MIRTLSCLSALLLGATLLGCNGGRADAVPTYEATGTVTMGGSPVSGAAVTFSPTGDGPPAFGRTGTDGKFTLTTYDNGDGAAAGAYKVMITKSEEGGGEAAGPPEGHDPENPEAFEMPAYPGEGTGTGSVLPDEYAKADTTPLTAEVTADGENNFEFDL